MRQTINGAAPFQVLATNFSIGPSNEGYTLQISADGNNYSDLFSVGANTTRMVTGVANGSFYRLSGNESEVVINWQTQCNDGGSGGGGSYVLPVASETTLGGVKVGSGLSIDSQGVLSSQGGGGSDSPIVALDSLSGTGEENTLYECDDLLWMWSNNSGVTAEWTEGFGPSASDYNYGFGLIFSHIPDGQTLFEAKFSYDTDAYFKIFKMSGDTLVMTDTGGTVISACTVGETKEFITRANGLSTYFVKAKVEKHRIGFYVAQNHNIRNIWDGTVTGGHFIIVDHTNYPYLNITGDKGFPKWNNSGQIIGKEDSYSVKDMYINTTSANWEKRFKVVGTVIGGSVPSNIFVPSQGGTEGQVLTSAGNAEPVWATLIKSVKITSAAYEALVQAGTTDPNTLYLIVNTV